MAIRQIGEAVSGHRSERCRHRVYGRVVPAGRAALSFAAYGLFSIAEAKYRAV